MKKIAIQLAIAASVFLGFQSCEKETTDTQPQQTVNDSVYLFIGTVMDYWYFWYNDMPSVDIYNYDTPENLLEDLKVSQDKWSFVAPEEIVSATFDEGEDFGFGISLGLDSQDSIRVAFVFNNTNAYSSGVRRGWLLEELNDQPVHKDFDFSEFFSTSAGSMKMKFRDNKNTIQILTLSRELFNQNGIFYTNTYEIDGKKTGYMVYNSFLGYTEDELINTIANLQAQSIDELIIDLRFNRGGYLDIAQFIANALVPPNKSNELFLSFSFNDQRSATHNEDLYFDTEALNLGLERVFFITNEYSASASELVINCLKPHMDVLHIGERTSGKPYAMGKFVFQDWVLYPVIAKTLNANGFAEYDDGIIPDITVFDEYMHDWGDAQEPALAKAFEYIQTGSFKHTEPILKGAKKPTILHEGAVLKPDVLIVN
ncbi:MAG TPA: hypothetical protein DDX98_04615 [Bacteroidales bacterium]|nr:hypothetical protein [Bacteroidales bacterium]